MFIKVVPNTKGVKNTSFCYLVESYRENGKNTVLCKQMKDAPYCGHQYFCPNTQRWENTEGARGCPLAAKAPMETTSVAVSITEQEETATKKKKKQ